MTVRVFDWLSILADCADSTSFVSKEVLDQVYKSLQEDTEPTVEHEAELDIDNHVFFVDAFEMPWWQYSLERQTFEKSVPALFDNFLTKHADHRPVPPSLARLKIARGCTETACK